MRTIWKFLVPFASRPIEAAPLTVGAILRHVDLDPETGNPAIWVELDPSAERHNRTFVAYPTGCPLPDNVVYVGTARCGVYLWHVFEVR